MLRFKDLALGERFRYAGIEGGGALTADAVDNVGDLIRIESVYVLSECNALSTRDWRLLYVSPESLVVRR
jgi:hypothetical protein